MTRQNDDNHHSDVGDVNKVNKVGNVGNVDKVSKVSKVSKVGKVGKVSNVDKVSKVGKASKVGNVDKVSDARDVDEGTAARTPATRTKAIPPFEQIKRYVLKQVAAQVWKPGELIPSEMELAKQFGVARMTVTRALRELTADLVLTRTQGAGTFVAPPKLESTLVELGNIADEIRGRGHRYEADVLALEASDSPLGLEALRLTQGPVYHSCIVHFEEGVPIQYEDRYVNPKVFPGYLAQDFTRDTPNHYLMHVAPVEHAEYRIFAQQPDARVRRRLLMEIGEPCLLLWRRTWIGEDVATSVTLWHPGARFQFSGTF